MGAAGGSPEPSLSLSFLLFLFGLASSIEESTSVSEQSLLAFSHPVNRDCYVRGVRGSFPSSHELKSSKKSHTPSGAGASLGPCGPEETFWGSWQKFSSGTRGVCTAGIAASKPNSPARPSMSLRNESSRLGDRLALDGAAEAGLEAELTEESVESAGERFWAPCGGKTGDGESIWKVSRAFVVSFSRKTLCLSCLVLLLFDRT